MKHGMHKNLKGTKCDPRAKAATAPVRLGPAKRGGNPPPKREVFR